MKNHGTAPIKEFRAGGIRAAIWRNEIEQDGRIVVRHSIKVEKRYHDKQADEWKSTDQFFPEDLARLQLVAAEAYRFTTLKQSEDDPGLPAVAR